MTLRVKMIIHQRISNFTSISYLDHSVWHEKFEGAVIFTKDYARRSFYIQIYEMQSYQKVQFISKKLIHD